MRKIVLFVSMLFIAWGISAQSMYGDEVKADVKMKYVYSFEEALQKAKEEKKPIFFNCFADWAIPCHVMNQMVFSDQKFADWMDKHFVNFFIDVTTKEGRPFAQKYDIRFQAHYLVLDSNGEIIYRIVGGRKIPEFQKLLTQALNPKTTLPEMGRRYESGERGVKFLRDYAGALDAADEKEKLAQVTDEFFEKLKKSQWHKSENWNLYKKKVHNLDDEMFRFMVANKENFVKQNGLKSINQSIEQVYFSELYPYATGKQVYDSEKLLNLSISMQNNGVPDTSVVYTLYDIVKARTNKDLDKIMDILEHRSTALPAEFVVYIDLGLADFPDLSTADEVVIINYLKKKMAEMQGRARDYYQEALNKLENKEGMKFENLPFGEVLKKAKQENKFVFLDCYTTWCGPCKQMSNLVFPLKSVGDFMNVRFVNVKIDMETDEGRELAKRYGVKAFPTMLLLDAEGEVISKIVGSQSPDVFLEKVKEGLKQSE